MNFGHSDKSKEKKVYVGIHPTVFNRLKSMIGVLKQERKELVDTRRKYEKAMKDMDKKADAMDERIDELEGMFKQLSDTFFDFKNAIKNDILDDNMKELKKEMNRQKDRIRKEALSYSYYVALLNTLFNINSCSSQDYQLLNIYLKSLDMLVQYLVENKSWSMVKKFAIDYLTDLKSKWDPLNKEIAGMIGEKVTRYSGL